MVVCASEYSVDLGLPHGMNWINFIKAKQFCSQEKETSDIETAFRQTHSHEIWIYFDGQTAKTLGAGPPVIKQNYDISKYRV